MSVVNNRKTVLSTGLFILGLIVTGKLIAFVKDIIISSYFGASIETDALFLSLNVTTIIFTAFYLTVTTVFLPLYNEKRASHGNEAASIFTSNALIIYVLITLLITFFGYNFSENVINLISLEKDNTYRNELSIDLLRVMVLSFVFSIIVSFLTTVQMNNNQYFSIHFIPIINSLIVALAVIFYTKKYGIYVIPVSGVIAWVLQVPLHLWICRRYFSFVINIDFSDRIFKKMGVIFLPAFLGALVDQANILVDTMIASNLDTGSISALNFSNRLISFASGIFIMAIMTITFPLLSKAIESKNNKALNSTIQSSLRSLILILSYITSIVFVYHQEIVTIVFERGKFDSTATSLTSSVFFYYGFGLVFLALRELFNKIFYANKNTKTPLKISILAVSVNIGLSLLLVQYLGVNGLALASSISLALYVIVQVVLLIRLIGSDFLKGILNFIAKVVFAMVWVFFVLYTNKYYFFTESHLINLILAIITSALIYAFSLLLLNVEELKILRVKFLSMKKGR